MEKISLDELILQHLETARATPSGRSSETIYGGHARHLRQTLIALRAGEKLHDHANPGEATLQVLHGRVTLTSANDAIDLEADEYVIIPQAIHAVVVHSDAALLLTVAVIQPQDR